jgi:hypothetical protein
MEPGKLKLIATLAAIKEWQKSDVTGSHVIPHYLGGETCIVAKYGPWWA